MALVAAGVGEGGRVMEPYLVKDVTTSAGRSVMLVPSGGRVWRVATDPATAGTVRDLMVNAVNNGSGARASIPGVQVAGKTGTAEVSKALEPHAWFIGFAPAADPTVAIAVIFENAGVGGQEAAPAARKVMQAALTAGTRTK
jgi:peptidoglycan glycosyltransferase